MIDKGPWDCVVIGGGPAGTTTAWKLAEKGRSVLVLEKRQEIGVPVRCGEGISKQMLSMVGLDDESWFIDKEMDGAIIYSPSMKELVLGPEIAGPEVGFVIRREALDRALAMKAARAGSKVMVRAEATGMRRIGNGWEIDVKVLNDEIKVEASVVVAADGFESQISSWAGLDTRISPRDMDSCIQYEMLGIDVREGFTEFYLGKEKAPGGYVWCFPKGNDIANVGLGLNGSMLKNGGEPKRYLDRFIENDPRFKKGEITEINAGGVSVSLPLESTITDSFLAVGDAARMIDPLTGGGIYNGCYAAIQAATTIDEALEKGDTSVSGLEPYERRWRDHLETEMARNYLAKEKLMEVSDEVLDKVIDAIAGYDLSEISTEELLKAVSSRYPEIMDQISI